MTIPSSVALATEPFYEKSNGNDHAPDDLALTAELTSHYGLETAMTAMERSIHGGHLSSCDAAVLDERIASFALDTRPTAGPSLAVYDQAFLRGGERHDAEDEGHVG